MGPYVNITVAPNELAKLNLTALNADHSVKAVTPENKHNYLIEHSQPNTHKELHIGHARNSILGDTLCRLLRQAGHDVHAENYHGDEGAHVAKCLWYMHENNLKPTADDNRGTWLGTIYVASTKAIEEASPEQAEEYKKKISEALKQIEEQSGEYFELWKETREWSMDLFHTFYEWLDVEFEREGCESIVSERSMQIVDEYFEKGVFVESDGAIGADLNDENLGFCLLKKSDGRGLYATKDIALALKRFEEVHPDTCIYVVDNRQSYHFKQVFATLGKMGFKESERCFHLAYDMVETKNGAMSSRKGNIVPILALIKQLQQNAFAILEERYKGQWSDEQIEAHSSKIALAAVRYGMLKVDAEKKITFDMNEWLTLEGNTGPYLQYVYTRMSSLERKSDEKDIDIFADIDWSMLNNNSEHQLLAHMAAFSDVLTSSCKQLKPHVFANYIYDFARKFNAFYAESPINNEEDVNVKRARLALVRLAGAYYGTALDLIGVPKLAQM